MDSNDFVAFEATLPPAPDEKLLAWRRQLLSLHPSRHIIREATPTPADARRMWDIQLQCEPITPLRLVKNAEIIRDSIVFFAEVEDVHVGFCIGLSGVNKSDPLFVQVVAVVPAAQGRGIGRALLAAVAACEPDRDIVLATQDSNEAARAMNARFAGSIGATLSRINLDVYPARVLGIRPGIGYRAWRIARAG